MLNQILFEIREKGFKVDGAIQHSYNPYVNDAIQFFIYSHNYVSYIVSTYRNPKEAKQRLLKQNDLMGCILRKIQDKPIKENILFSAWLLNLPQGCFRIQEFKEKKIYLQASKHGLKDFQQYLNISCSWIRKFQIATTSGTEPVHHLIIRKNVKQDILNLKFAYSQQSEVLGLLNFMERKVKVINTSMKTSMNHGDYFYGNCFIDDDDIFRVFDWEFASISEWIIFDSLSNLITVWIALRNNDMARTALKAFFEPWNDNEKLLSQKLYELKQIHGLEEPELKFYIAYVFIRIFFRKERATAKLGNSKIQDIISILKSIGIQ